MAAGWRHGGNNVVKFSGSDVKRILAKFCSDVSDNQRQAWLVMT